MLKFALEKILDNENLTQDEMINAMNIIMEGNATDAQIGGFLTGLRMKGETINEIAAGAKAMRQKASKININDRFIIDTCGTGGDGANTFNISTISAFVAAACGITVLKHGNRAVSSKCGSADVLEHLGVNMNLGTKQVEKCARELGIGFVFAPDFHNAMKFAIKARKDLKMRTIFNLLGPLANPANVNGHIIGVFDEKLTKVFAAVLKELGIERALVVHGLDGLDEITITTKTKVSELKDNEISNYYIDPMDYGFELGNTKDIIGGNADENSKIILSILKGEKGPRRDIVILNAGAAIYVGKKADSIKEGIYLAQKAVDEGLAYEKLSQFIRLSQEMGR